ncbi:MAG: chemotaxis protein CheD [Gemmatimonadaceae bacterium]
MNEIRVKVADFAVAGNGAVIATIGLGSCVAIALFDPLARIGGLAHILLPSVGMSQDRDNRAKFAGTAVPLLIEHMRAVGGRVERMRAKIAGGASMFTTLLPASGIQMGERNIRAAREALTSAQVPLISEDVGGNHGRSVYFYLATGDVLVKSLRLGDVTI